MLNSESAIAEEPGRPLWQWCVASFLLVALLGSAIDAIELYLTNRFGWHSLFWLQPKVELSVGSALGVIVFVPVGETLLLAWTVGLLKSAGLTVWRIVAYSAIGQIVRQKAPFKLGNVLSEILAAHAALGS